MKKSGELFRKSVNGYNKNDVNDYIESASIKAKKREAEFEDKIRSLEAELSLANERAAVAESRDFSDKEAEYREEIEELKRRHIEERQKENEAFLLEKCELEEKLSESNKVIAAQSEYIEKLKDAVSKLQGELEASREVLDAYETKKSEISALNEKALKYDSISAQIGELMLNAGNTAEQIINEAKNKAAEIVAEADKKSNDTLYVLKKYTEKYCDRLGEVTVASAKERLNRIHTEMAEFEASVSRSIADVQSSTSPINVHIESLRNSLETSLDSILSRNATGYHTLEENEENELIERQINSILSDKSNSNT